MNLINFIEWCQSPGVYEWAMRSCQEVCLKIFSEDC